MPPSTRSRTNFARVTSNVLTSAQLWSNGSQTSRNGVVKCVPMDAATNDEGEVVLTLAVFRGNSEDHIKALAQEIKKGLQDWEKDIFDLKDPLAFNEMLKLRGDSVTLQHALSDAMGKAYQVCWDDDNALVSSIFPEFYVEIGVTRNEGSDEIQQYSRKLVITISNDRYHENLGPVGGASTDERTFHPQGAPRVRKKTIMPPSTHPGSEEPGESSSFAIAESSAPNTVQVPIKGDSDRGVHNSSSPHPLTFSMTPMIPMNLHGFKGQSTTSPLTTPRFAPSQDNPPLSGHIIDFGPRGEVLPHYTQLSFPPTSSAIRDQTLQQRGYMSSYAGQRPITPEYGTLDLPIRGTNFATFPGRSNTMDPDVLGSLLPSFYT
ncbi:hypothetical protein TREMEDRAFT_62623 [Tremella mesenterica DSM 1558]|uniref:uncharacterized protein n=1 Tax=Tremella mesenterica (strain ATCC 24925 / CBS 8224 / DSM 1558 / NBRC 9311 / NRRL Y-6157 / RJB 2259-6 / UBC 559-6) TaxID=578456 RepID=UPI0003F49578|nr:uncharacterized protein TREMEDRAFT_62623 [Tremella mesenterica DSM 1558]EIW68905.1 hypothetical protein TREMEDRAFT_62623 [Tremella mesenterica DSM 1558]